MCMIMIIMKSITQALDAAADAWLEAVPRAHNTARSYRTELDRLLRFARRHDASVDARALARFWRGLCKGAWHETRQPPTPRSLDQSRRILSAFIRSLVQQELAPASALIAVAAWRTPAPREPTSRADARRMRSIPIARLLHVSDLDAAAAALCFWVGATPGELAALLLQDVDLVHARITLTQQGVRRTVAIPRLLAKAFEPLFAHAHGPWAFRVGPERTTAAALGQRVARWLRVQGGEVTSARALRALFQRFALSKGWSGDDVRAQLRRPRLPLPPAKSPSHRKLATLAGGGVLKRPNMRSVDH